MSNKEENDPIDLFNEEWSDNQILFQFCKGCDRLENYWDFNINAQEKVKIPRDFPNCFLKKGEDSDFKGFYGFYFYNGST